MEMWLKQSTLMLLTVALSAAVADKVFLNETLKDVSVDSNLTLHCPLETKTERFWTSWYFNSIGPSLINSIKLGQNLSNNTKEDLTYTFKSVKLSDSGWYFCEVVSEIPTLEKTTTNGTYINIIPSTANLPIFRYIDWWMWLLLAISVLILIVLMVIYITLRKRCSRSSVEEPIYANSHSLTNKQPSPRDERLKMNLKTTSSSQHLNERYAAQSRQRQ